MPSNPKPPVADRESEERNEFGGSRTHLTAGFMRSRSGQSCAVNGHSTSFRQAPSSADRIDVRKQLGTQTTCPVIRPVFVRILQQLQAHIFLVHDGVALTRRLFQAFTILDPHVAA